MKNILLLGGAALCLIAFSGPSFATNTDTPPADTPPADTPPIDTPVTPDNPTPVGIATPSQSVVTGATSASAAAAAAAAARSGSLATGGNSRTNIDASDRSSYRSRAIFIPPVVPGTPPSQLAVGNIISETSACGPLQHIVRQPVTGTFIGLFRNASIEQGWSDDLEPYRDASGMVVDYRRDQLPNGDVRLFGHQVMMFTTVIGVASNRNIALGGGSGGGSWGQGGMGSSSSNQRMVTTIQLRDCEIGTMRTVYVEVPSKPIRG